MKKVVRLTETDLVRIVKRVISEQKTTPMKFGGGTPSPKNDPKNKDSDGFYNISYSDIGNVKSVQNAYNGGKTESARSEFTSNESLLNPVTKYIAFNYWFNNKAGDTMSIVLNAKSSDGTVTTETWSNRGPDSNDGKYMGRFYLGPLPDNSKITVTVEGDNYNSLTITTGVDLDTSVNCDTEWKTVYQKLEESADKNNSIDVRPYYCSKDQTNVIKGIYPEIDSSKLFCLKQKIKKQYCK